jgi:hypothetical protein
MEDTWSKEYIIGNHQDIWQGDSQGATKTQILQAVTNKRQLLIPLKTVVVKFLSPVLLGDTSTPSLGTFLFKLVSKNTVSCHSSSVYYDSVVLLIHYNFSNHLKLFVVICMTAITHFLKTICVILKDTLILCYVFEVLANVTVKIFLRCFHSWFTFLMLVVMMVGSNWRTSVI